MGNLARASLRDSVNGQEPISLKFAKLQQAQYHPNSAVSDLVVVWEFLNADAAVSVFGMQVEIDETFVLVGGVCGSDGVATVETESAT